MKKLYLLLICLTINSAYLFSQYTINGTASSQLNTYDRIVGATVSIDDGAWETTTDGAGEYSFSNIPGGNHTITIYHYDYFWEGTNSQTTSQNIYLSGSQTVSFRGRCRGNPVINVDIPDSYSGDYFDITMNFRNINYYTTDVIGYLDISFPDITDSNYDIQVLQNNYFQNPVIKEQGSSMWHIRNREWATADYLLYSFERHGTINQTTHPVTLRIRPQQSGDFRIYVKASIGDQRDPTSGTIGQQGIYELSYTVHENSPPGEPYNEDPENGLTNVSINLAELDWSCFDPDGDNVDYRVYLEANDSSPDDVIDEPTGSSSNLDFELQPSTTYYWQVIAIDDYGLETDGPIWHFTTESSTGSIEVTVQNIDGQSTPFPGSGGLVDLYNSNNSFVEGRSTNSYGEVTFTNLMSGTYWVNVFHNSGLTIHGQEFWGKFTNLNVVGGDIIQETLTRYMPYIETVQFYNNETSELLNGQEIPPGTEVRVEATVRNNGGAFAVRTNLMVDRDKSGGYDIQQTSNAHSIAFQGTYTFQFVFAIESEGDYSFTINAETYYSDLGGYVTTDGWEWSQTMFSVGTTTGNIEFAVNNIPGGSTAFPGNNGTVELYNQGDALVNTQSTINGVAAFTNIPTGSGYYCKVYHNSGTTASGIEYWGQSPAINISENSTANYSFTRYLPYKGNGTEVIVDGVNVGWGASIPLGTEITLRVPVNNPNTISHLCSVNLILDKDRASPYDLGTYTAVQQTVVANGSLYFEFSFTPEGPGTYYRSIGILTNIDGQYVITDGTDWNEAEPIFNIEENLPIGTINLLEPTGGETWLGGTTEIIRWEYTGNIAGFEILYSTNNGLDWERIVQINPDLGEYNWPIPNDINSSECLIRINGYFSGESTSDETEQTFTIIEQVTVNPIITLFGEPLGDFEIELLGENYRVYNFSFDENLNFPILFNNPQENEPLIENLVDNEIAELFYNERAFERHIGGIEGTYKGELEQIYDYYHFNDWYKYIPGLGAVLGASPLNKRAIDRQAIGSIAFDMAKAVGVPYGGLSGILIDGAYSALEQTSLDGIHEDEIKALVLAEASYGGEIETLKSLKQLSSITDGTIEELSGLIKMMNHINEIEELDIVLKDARTAFEAGDLSGASTRMGLFKTGIRNMGINLAYGIALDYISNLTGLASLEEEIKAYSWLHDAHYEGIAIISKDLLEISNKIIAIEDQSVDNTIKLNYLYYEFASKYLLLRNLIAELSVVQFSRLSYIRGNFPNILANYAGAKERVINEQREFFDTNSQELENYKTDYNNYLSEFIFFRDYYANTLKVLTSQNYIDLLQFSCTEEQNELKVGSTNPISFTLENEYLNAVNITNISVNTEEQDIQIVQPNYQTSILPNNSSEINFDVIVNEAWFTNHGDEQFSGKDNLMKKIPLNIIINWFVDGQELERTFVLKPIISSEGQITSMYADNQIVRPNDIVEFFIEYENIPTNNIGLAHILLEPNGENGAIEIGLSPQNNRFALQEQIPDGPYGAWGVKAYITEIGGEIIVPNTYVNKAFYVVPRTIGELSLVNFDEITLIYPENDSCAADDLIEILNIPSYIVEEHSVEDLQSIANNGDVILLGGPEANPLVNLLPIQPLESEGAATIEVHSGVFDGNNAIVIAGFNIRDTQIATIGFIDEYSSLLNHSPEIEPQTFTVDENSPQNTVIGTVAAFDIDTEDQLTFLFNSDSGPFNMNPETGVIFVDEPENLNFENQEQYFIEVLVTDNGTPVLSNTAVITINVTNVNDSPIAENVTLSPENPTTESDLSLTYLFIDEDENTEQESIIRWFRDGNEVLTLGNLYTITSENIDVGQRWHATVTPHDGIDYGGEYTSNTVIIGGSSSGTTWFVSTTGSDETGNGSEENPFATIQHGIDQALENDIVFVYNGEYHEYLVIDKNIHVVGESNLNTKIIGDNSYQNLISFSGTTNATLSNVRMGNAENTTQLQAIFMSSCDYNTSISNCVFDRISRGVVTHPNNLGLSVINNTFYGNGGFRAISIGGGNIRTTSKIKNNIITNYYTGISVNNVAGFPDVVAPEITHNNSWNNTGGNYYLLGEDLTGLEGNISEAPLFENEENSNFELTYGSPCVDAGDPTFPLDANGTRADIGAIPYLKPAPPTANDGQRCGAGTVQLSASGASEGDSYRWYYSEQDVEPFSNGAIIQTPSITTTTTYYVSIYSNGYESEKVPVIAHIQSAINVDINQPETVCQGETVILDAGSGFDSYLWSTGETTQTIEVNTAGTYSVTVYQGECLASDEVSVSFYPLPSTNLGSPHNGCEGDVITLDAGPGFVSYRWSTGLEEQFLEVSESGYYSVRITDENGCENTFGTEVIINWLPYPEISPYASFCEGGSTVLDADMGFESYHWSNGETTPQITIFDEGTYSVSVTNEFGCMNDASMDVYFDQPPVVDLGGPYSLCEGEELVLDAGAGNYTYLWSTGETEQMIFVAESGNYSVAIEGAPGCIGADETSVLFTELPEILLNDSYTSCEGQAVELDAGPGFATYLWSTGETTQTISVNEDGVYFVAVTNEEGCENTAETNVTIYPLPEVELGGPYNSSIGESVTLDASSGFASYLWNTGATTQTIEVSESGNYSLTVTNENNCSVFDETVVIFEGASYIIANPDAIELEYPIGSQASFDLSSNTNWSISSNDPQVTVNPTGGSDNATITLTTIAENSTSDTLFTTIIIDGGSITETVSVRRLCRFISVTQPALGEIIYPGEIMEIRWEDNFPENVQILLFDGVNFSPIIQSTESDGSYSWRVPEDLQSGVNYQIRMQSIYINDIYDYSERFTVPEVLTINPTSLQLGYESGSDGSFEITSNLDWEINTTASWLNLEPTSGSNNETITVTANSENPSTTETRPATITITGGSYTRTVTVIQEPVCYFSVEPTEIILNSDAGSSDSFSISSNADWSLSSDADWLTLSATGNSNNASITATTASPNPSTTESRTATITASSDCGFTRTILIIQESSKILTVNPTSINLGYESGSNDDFNITSNVAWTVSDDTDWLDISLTSGSNDGLVTVTANNKNPSTTDVRTAIVTVNGGDITRTVVVTQEPACYFSVTPNSLLLNFNAGSSGSFNISTNSDWSINNDADWITISPASGSNDATITVTAASSNPSTTEPRVARISITGCSGTVIITLTQEPSPESSYLTVSPTTLTLGAESGANDVFNISSNVGWTVSNDVSWLDVSPTSGTDDGTVVVTANSENTELESRSATITLESDDTDPVIVTVTQEAKETSISIITPNGGETLEVGKTHTIKWESLNISKVNITYSINNGTDWESIVNEYNSTGTYDWLVTEPESNQCRVKITSSVDNEVYDISESVFIIYGPTGIGDIYSNLKFKIYPNPTLAKIYLEPSENVDKEVIFRIIDMSGNQVSIKKFNQLRADIVYEIDLSNLNYGIYNLQISNKNLYRIEKIIKH